MEPECNSDGFSVKCKFAFNFCWKCLRSGIGFGLTSGILATLGMAIGLSSSGTNSRQVVISGILLLAVTETLADALAMHISVESESEHSPAEIWVTTISTMLSKILVALTFLIPVILLPLDQAMVANIVWGVLLLTLFSYYIGRVGGENPWGVVLEHLVIAGVIIIMTYFLGIWLESKFS